MSARRRTVASTRPLPPGTVLPGVAFVRPGAMATVPLQRSSADPLAQPDRAAVVEAAPDAPVRRGVASRPLAVAVAVDLVDRAARRRPLSGLRGPDLQAAPSAERLSVMQRVLEGGVVRAAPAPAPPAADAPGAWGPWPAPHTPAWPVVVPSWGGAPPGFAQPLRVPALTAS